MVRLEIFTIICLLLYTRTQPTVSIHLSNFIMDLPSTNNPDTYLTTPKIVRRYGYPSEIHVVQSADGYLLELHRIPHGKTKTTVKKDTPIYLQHGVLCTSYDWVVHGPEKSLGYQLADKGYDVWLGNMRGNTYSRSHVANNPKHKQFWDFSFHESGYYDLPAVIDYILQETNSTQLIYIGYSMGTTVFYVMCSEKPEYNDKIKLHIALAPVASLTYSRSYFTYLMPYAGTLQKLIDLYNHGEVLERNILIRLGTKLLCSREILGTNVCIRYVMDKFFGANPKGIDKTLVPVVVSHIPAGTSMKNLVHFTQMYYADRFQKYDYGHEINKIMYNQSTPPKYDVNKITVPCAFYYGENDLIADSKDVRLLYHKLSNPVQLYKVKDSLFTHLDFMLHSDINRLLNYNVLDLIENSQIPGYLEKRVDNNLHERWDTMKNYSWFYNVMGFNNSTSTMSPQFPNQKTTIFDDENNLSSSEMDEGENSNRRILLQKRNSNRSIQIIQNEYRKNIPLVAVR